MWQAARVSSSACQHSAVMHLTAVRELLQVVPVSSVRCQAQALHAAPVAGPEASMHLPPRETALHKHATC